MRGCAVAGLRGRPSAKPRYRETAPPFARSVSRDDIYHGVEELGVDLEEHITFVKNALMEIADQIGVAGVTQT